MKVKILILFLFFCSIINSQTTPEIYIETYKDLAIKEMYRTGIPAAVTLAQGFVESGFGNSYLAKKANNHFGIKCKSNWKGEKIFYQDDDADNCFRKYKTVEDSYKDHSNFLKTRIHYKFLFQLDPLDYQSWCYGLKKTGYSTNPNYAKQLIDCIEKYNLNEYSKCPTLQEN